MHALFRWFFHSKDDNVIGVEETDKIVEALRRSGMLCCYLIVMFLTYKHNNELSYILCLYIMLLPQEVYLYSTPGIMRAMKSQLPRHGWWDTIAGQRPIALVRCGNGYSVSLCAKEIELSVSS